MVKINIAKIKMESFVRKYGLSRCVSNCAKGEIVMQRERRGGHVPDNLGARRSEKGIRAPVRGGRERK